MVRYRLHVDTRVWLPDRIDRYDMAGIPLEFTIFRNFRVNQALDRAFFDSGYREAASSPPQAPVRP